MSDVFEVRMPNFGEGMHYAKVISILGKIGDRVEEESGILIVETDKTSIEVPAPVAGVVTGVFCEEGQVVNVGTPILSIKPAQGRLSSPERSPKSSRGEKCGALTGCPVSGRQKEKVLPSRQISLIKAMQRSRELVVPASMEARIEWQKLQNLRRDLRALCPGNVPSSQALICWGVAQAMLEYEKFRSKITDQDKLIVDADAKIGIASAEEEDTLGTDSICVAKESSFHDFMGMFRNAMRSGITEDKTGVAGHSLIISDMSAFGIISAQPVVVYPSIATLFIGTPFLAPGGKTGKVCEYANIVLAFDHRAINGSYAARFLKRIKTILNRLCEDKEYFLHTGGRQESSGAIRT